MTQALAKTESNVLVRFSEEEQLLIRKTFGPNLTQGEFELFLYTAQAVGLNPLKRQIYAVKRKQWNSQKNAYEERMTIQTGIDGFRAVSSRNQTTIPGREPEFVYGSGGYKNSTKSNPANLISATAYLKVFGRDNQYHEISATAYWDEYVPLKQDGTPQAMWAKMPRTMLAKCAEALLHRKSNPEQLSGIYTTEEMNQADGENAIETTVVRDESKPVASLPNVVNETATGARSETPALEAEIVETTDGKGLQGVIPGVKARVEMEIPPAEVKDLDKEIEHDIEQVQKVFPEAKVTKVQKKGKFGFLDEIRRLKADLKKANGNDEEYYQIMGVIGPGSYQHANEIDDRNEQIAFWKALKTALSAKGEKE